MIYSIRFGMFFGAVHSGKAMPPVSSWKPLQPPALPMAGSGLILVATEPRKGEAAQVLCAPAKR